MWHASIASHGDNGQVQRMDSRWRPPPQLYWQRAEKVLRGVGDASLGEWRDVGDGAVHLRRRLSALEQAQRGLVVRDVRGTPEADELLAPVRHLLPAGYHE